MRLMSNKQNKKKGKNPVFTDSSNNSKLSSNAVVHAKLKIELLSNACIALGSSSFESVDMDIYRDEKGNPYIPSKRIKGLIRAALEEYKNISNEVVEIDRILGNSTITDDIVKGEAGSLYIGDATSNNATSSIKTQTAIGEDGIAKAGSLRTMQVVDKGTVFESSVTLENEEDFKLLKKVLPLLRHMGLNRNRGLGLVNVHIEKDNSRLETLKSNTIIGNLVKIKIENTSNLLVSSIDIAESLPYIPSSTILGYFANKYIKITNDEKSLKELFLDDGHLIFSNGYISDEDYNEYIPCPAFIKKYKNLSEDGTVEYVNKFTNETKETKVERKIASLDGKYIKYDTFKNGIDINNIKVIEPTFEYAYHNSLDELLSVKEFYQYFSLEKGQHFVAYVYGSNDKLKKLFAKVNDTIVYFGKSKNSQYGKCKIEIEDVKEDKNTGNVLIFKAPVTLNFEGKELLEANTISGLIKDGLTVSNYSLKYTNLGGFNMLWGLPKVAKTAIDGGSYIEFEGVKTADIVSFLDKCNVSKLDYLIVSKENLTKSVTNSNNINKLNKQIHKEEMKKETSEILKIKERAYNKYEETSSKVNLNQTQIERLLMLLKETISLKDFDEQVGSIASEKIKKGVNKMLDLIKSDYDENNYKDYLTTYLNLLKWEGRK